MKLSVSELHRYWKSGWGFDALYDFVFVTPFVWIAKTNKADIIDKFYSGIVSGTTYFHRAFAWSQSGIMRWYMMGIVVGTIIVVTISLLVSF